MNERFNKGRSIKGCSINGLYINGISMNERLIKGRSIKGFYIQIRLYFIQFNFRSPNRLLRSTISSDEFDAINLGRIGP